MGIWIHRDSSTTGYHGEWAFGCFSVNGEWD